jgi:CheY-like chemotaxis protein
VRLPPGDYVVLSITDTGLGLSDELREHLFEPFFGTAQPGKNTGLGLATVYAIVKQHGGHIHCTSEPGKGSTFTAYFPALKGVTREQRPLQRLPESTDRGGVILLAEDEEVLREFAQLILRKHGYHVLAAGDGLEALQIAEQFARPFDLLFTDVVMPRLAGTDLFKRFSEQHPNTPVIFTSGYPRSILAESGLDSEELDFLQKPYTSQALLEKIRQVLTVSRERRSSLPESDATAAP